MRDDFTETTKRNVAQRVAWRCSRPECRLVTAGPHTDDAKSLNVGVAAHITAASPDGPRFDASLSVHDRKAPANAIWLCQVCGKLVDNDAQQFSASTLREWKNRAETAGTFEIAKTAESLPASHDEIRKLFKRYAPEATAEVLFREAYDTLSVADPHLKYTVSVDGNVVNMTVVRRDGDPVSVSLHPTFPDTEFGRRKAEEYQRFLDEGSQVELDQTCVSLEDLPEPVRRAARYRSGEFRLTLGPRRPKRLAVAFIVRNEDGETYEFPYIDLATNHFEGDVVVLTNEQQAIPFKFEERLYPDRHAKTTWTFEGEGRTFWWLRELLRFQAIVSKPSVTIIRDLDDGMEYFATVAGATTLGAFVDARIVERVVSIQERTKTAIRIPPRQFFTPGDIQQLEFVEHVLATGLQPSPPTGITITARGPDAPSVLRNIQESHGPVATVIPMHIENLLDNQVPLGPIELYCPRMRVAPSHKARLEAYLTSGSTEEATFLFVPDQGEVIEARFTNWT